MYIISLDMCGLSLYGLCHVSARVARHCRLTWDGRHGRVFSAVSDVHEWVQHLEHVLALFVEAVLDECRHHVEHLEVVVRLKLTQHVYSLYDQKHWIMINTTDT